MLYLGFFIFTTLGLSYIPALVHLIKCMIPSCMWYLSTNWQKILWQIFRHIDQKTYCNGFIFWWMIEICATGITSNVCEQIKYNVRVAVSNGHLFSRVAQSQMRIIRESPHDDRHFGNPYILFFTCICGLKTQKNLLELPLIDRCAFVVNGRSVGFWYCDVTQTTIVTSCWPIFLRTFLSESRESFCCPQVGYHSLLTESD